MFRDLFNHERIIDPRIFFLIKDIKGKIIILNIGSLSFIENDRNAPGKLLEKCLTSSQVESDLSMRTFIGLFNYKKIDEKIMTK